MRYLVDRVDSFVMIVRQLKFGDLKSSIVLESLLFDIRIKEGLLRCSSLEKYFGTDMRLWGPASNFS